MDRNSDSPQRIQLSSRQIIHVLIQVVALSLLLIYSFNVLQSFITPVVWAAILAVALYPMHQRLKKAFGGKGTLAAIAVTIIMLAFFILPSVWLTVASASEVKDVVNSYQDGKLRVPPPPSYVQNWPLIGHKTYNIWQQASNNLDSLIEQNPDQARSVVTAGIGMLTSTGKGILIFTLSIIVSGVLLGFSKQAEKFARTFFDRLIGISGFDMTSIASITIRNVVKGILAVAFIQSTLAGIGMYVAGIPYAGVWTLLCVVLAIVQIGITPISIAMIIYIWSTGSTGTAILLTIWMIGVGLLDNVLKPILMGKGAPVPMLVIFLGSLGGFIYSGFIGLFTGAVILSLGYRLFEVWLKGESKA